MNAAILLVLISAAPIDVENRVPNAEVGAGVCWWACADTIGRQYDIRNLVGIRDAVAAHGYGATSGAAYEHIWYWMYKTNTKFEAHYSGKDSFLTEHLDAGVAPIVVLRWTQKTHELGWTYWTSHAVILMDVYKTRDGSWYVQYYDPNQADSNYTASWSWFKSRWTGDAYVMRKGKLLEGIPTYVFP